MKRKIAVIFPGIGYTCDKPLLYYSAKLASGCGYETIPVPYKNFPSNIRGNKEKMEESFCSALKQAEEILKDVNFVSCQDILFISKSVGTVVSAAFAKKRGLDVHSISFTPLEETFLFARGSGIMLHGTSDPWVRDSDAIKRGCEKLGQPLYIIENANHSLETGDVKRDLENMQKIMKWVELYIKAL